MGDQRIKTLAGNLLSYSLKLEAGEKVLIDTSINDTSLARALVDEAYRLGGIPFVELKDPKVLRKMLMQPCMEMWQTRSSVDTQFMEMMDAYISIRGTENSTELADVPPESMKIYQKEWMETVHMRIRVPKKKWVVLRWPTPSFAQSASMSSEAFEDFYFKVCLVDYAKMARAMVPLVAMMEETDQVHIKGKNTDLHFSISAIPVIKCAGERNIPDGEVFTAPVKDSINGKISYTARTLYQGTVFEGISLQFRNGKIVDAQAGDKTDKLVEILGTDEGARYVGEFAIGVNPYIKQPMQDTLFDEKIMGSFHFTPGNAYKEADNGNRSAIHWDMVCIQTPEHGGGEILFDGNLIRKDGLFVHPDLVLLNPENLIEPDSNSNTKILRSY